MNAAPMPETPAPQRPCVACRTRIDPEANLCPVCRSYQANWKNWLPYFGSAAGLIAIVASALTFISGNVFDWYKTATWRDSVDVAYFEYPGQSGFINTGDGAVVISSMVVRLDPASKTINIPINQQVEHGKFAVVSANALYKAPDGVDEAAWAKNPTGAFNEKLEETATNYTDPRRCAEFHLYNAHHLVFMMIDTMQPGRKLISHHVTAQLNVVSLHTGKQFMVPLDDIQIAFLFIARDKCKERDFGVDPG